MKFGGRIHLNKTGFCVVAGCIVVLFFYMFLWNVPKSQNIDVNLKKLLITAITAAQSGGYVVVEMANVKKVTSKGKTKEGADDKVTSADFRSHCVMTELLHRNFPEITVVSEESNTKCVPKQTSHSQQIDDKEINSLFDHWVNADDVTVWIDPLDGTQEYTEGLNQYVTTMVCVALKGKPVIGVIYKPFTREIYWGWTDNGKSTNLLPKEISNKHETKFLVSRSHAGKVAKVLKDNFKNFTIVVAGGAGYKALEIVKGNADAYLHVTAIKKWDICSGNAILNALGGKMTTIKNANIDYGDTKNLKNEDGLIATLNNHQFYVDGLMKNYLS